METKSTVTEFKNTIRNKLPYLLRAVGVLSLILSIISFILYVLAAVFHKSNPNILSVNDILGVKENANLLAYVLISATLNLIIMVSIIQTFKVRKRGLWLLLVSSIGLLINEIIFNNQIFVSYVSIYLIYSLLILLYSGRFFSTKTTDKQ